ncbi:MAG: hypothetical protein ACMXX6_01980 [Candidatus Woesearchaeota archaeon]
MKEEITLDKVLKKAEKVWENTTTIKKINVLDFSMGTAIGTIDTIASGLPIFSFVNKAYQSAKFTHTYLDKNAPYREFIFDLYGDKPLKEYAKSSAYYLLGVSIPFTIKYSGEITEFLHKYSSLL